MPDTPSFYDEVTLSAGDRIVFEPLPTYKGYYGSCCRCFHIGPLPDEARKKDEGVDHAQAAAIAAIKPGVKAKQLLEVIEAALQDQGMGSTIEMAGSLGLSMLSILLPVLAVVLVALFLIWAGRKVFRLRRAR